MESIIKQFAITTPIGAIRPLKVGHINDSFIVDGAEGNKGYFLQKINHNIFKDVKGLQSNIQQVTDHLRKKLSEAGETDIERKVLQLVPTKDGELFFKDSNGDYWRIYELIEDTQSQDAVTPESAYITGVAFGRFQTMLADLSVDNLIETIPNFHNMEFRLQQFREALEADAVGRKEKCKEIIAEIEKRAENMCKAERLFREGKLPKRINHCDTKVNNILFDKNGEVLCIVDLDTVMPGFVLSDFGDFMRTAGNTGEEDDTNLDNVNFNMEIFEAYTKGYLKNATFLTPIEKENLPYGATLLTYMQTVRFLTDYINGDTYYKIHSPEHNWQRTLAQFKLLTSIEENLEHMNKFIFNCG